MLSEIFNYFNYLHIATCDTATNTFVECEHYKSKSKSESQNTYRFTVNLHESDNVMG